MIFLDTFDDAFAHAERLRCLFPAVYNPARVGEVPIPPVYLINAVENEAQIVQHNEEIENDVASIGDTTVASDEAIENAENHGGPEILIASANATNTEEIDVQVTQNSAQAENEQADEAPEQNDVSVTVKIKSFGDVVMPPDDLNAINSLFARGNDSTCVEQPVDLPDNSVEELPDIANHTDDSSDDQIECFFESLNDFRPIVLMDGYTIKANDVLSNNIPFKINVSLNYL